VATKQLSTRSHSDITQSQSAIKGHYNLTRSPGGLHHQAQQLAHHALMNCPSQPAAGERSQGRRGLPYSHPITTILSYMSNRCNTSAELSRFNKPPNGYDATAYKIFTYIPIGIHDKHP
jgi:hypothetical protein